MLFFIFHQKVLGCFIFLTSRPFLSLGAQHHNLLRASGNILVIFFFLFFLYNRVINSKMQVVDRDISLLFSGIYTGTTYSEIVYCKVSLID